MAFDTEGCDTASRSAPLSHAAHFHDRQQHVQVVQLEPAADAIIRLCRDQSNELFVYSIGRYRSASIFQRHP
jgi:hypothetical protein